jgi:HEAT repeat protein
LAPSPDSVSLASVIRELGLAWQKLSLYQEGHPLRGEALRQAHAELVRLVARHGVLVVGVTRETLVGADEKLESPAARKLAAALHRRGVAVVRFSDGVEPEELGALLALLSQRPAADDAPLWDDPGAAELRHVAFEAVDFSELIAAGAAAKPATVSLWDRLLERLLAAGAGREATAATGARTLAAVLAAIQTLLARHQRAAAREAAGAPAEGALALLATALQEAVGSHLAATHEDGAEGPAVEQVAELLAAVPAVLRAPVLDAALGRLCGVGEERQGLERVAAAVPPADLLASLRRLRREGFALAPEALLALEDPISEAAAAMGPAGEPAAVAARLGQLFADEDVDRIHAEGADQRPIVRLPRPAAGAARATAAADLGERLDSLGDQRLMVQVSQALFELLRRALFDAEQKEAIARRLEGVFRHLLAAGRVASALRIARSLEGLAPGRPGLRDRDAVAALVEALGEATPAAQAALVELVELLGPPVLRGLVLALGEEEDRSRRRRIFDLLATLGPGVAPQAVALLADPRWFVVRNMLSLLGRVGGGLTAAAVAKGLGNADPRVRLEAAKGLAALDAEVPADLIAAAIRDSDPRVAETAIASLGRRALGAARGPLLALLAKGNPLGCPAGLQAKALEALGQLGDPAVLPEIQHFFRGWLGGVGAAERRAAFAALAHYPAAARRPLVERGLRSPDPEVRAICARLGSAAPAPPAVAPPPPGDP